MSFSNIFREWKGARECGWAQLQMVVILLIAYIGDRWPRSYPRNDNHNPNMFWVMNLALLTAALISMKHEPTTRNVQLLSRAQTEEWKGWMQWAFVMYHYYRVYYVYNEIRVFVSAYVWYVISCLYSNDDGDDDDDAIEPCCSPYLHYPCLSLYLSLRREIHTG